MYFIILALLLYSLSAASTEQKSQNWNDLLTKATKIFTSKEKTNTRKELLAKLFTEFVQKIEKLEAENNKLTSTLQEKETLLKDLQKEKEELFLQINTLCELSKDHIQLTKDHNELNQKYDTLELEKNELSNKYNELSQKHNKLQTEAINIALHLKKRQESVNLLTNEDHNLNLKLNEKENPLNSLLIEKRKLTSEINTHRELSEKHIQLTKDHNELNQKYNELNCKNNELQDEARKLKLDLEKQNTEKEKLQKVNVAKKNNITNNNEGATTIETDYLHELHKSEEKANLTRNIAIGVALTAIGILAVAVNTVMSKQTAAAFPGYKNS
jgi:chromosome segregation ATPase